MHATAPWRRALRPVHPFERVCVCRDPAAAIELVLGRIIGNDLPLVPEDISQTDIVRQTFGTLVDVPADPFTLVRSIKRTYAEGSGQTFDVSSRLWSIDFGTAEIDNGTLMQSLVARRPLIVCNASHMMVLIGVMYDQWPDGTLDVTQAWVADPMTSGSVTHGIPGLPELAPGFRYLFPNEMMPMRPGGPGQLRFVAELLVT